MEFDYNILLDQKTSLLSYALLLMTILSVWVKRTPILWGAFLSSAVATGLIAGRVQWIALGTIIIYGSVVWAFFRIHNKPLKTIFAILIFILSMLLWFHKLPGFQNWQIANGLLLSPNAFPLNLYLNFDKPLIAIFLLGFGTLPLQRGIQKTINFRLLFNIIVACAIIGMIAMFANMIQWDLKFGSFFWVWALNNLVFVCVTEEVLFRGFVQEQLSKVFSRYRIGSILALVISALSFGLSHLGPFPYVALVTLCGIFYGTVYLKTKKIEMAIWAHFLLNAIHIIGFSYPLLARVS